MTNLRFHAIKEKVREETLALSSTVELLPAERQSNRAAPEVEAAEREIETASRRLVVLNVAEVTDVAAHADVVVEVRVQTRADVNAEIVR